MSMILVIGLFLISLANHGAKAFHETQEDFRCLSQFQPYRTGYHFQPPHNWMNDPNGPIYYKGIYHLFYQYNPYSALWGNISWAHSISYDLVNWVHLDNALNPTHSYDINGCFSGSITILPGDEPVILYTGVDSQYHQVQNLAVPKDLSDPFLKEWTKSPHNPVMTPSNGLVPESFRDPTTAWQGPDGVWRVVVGAEVDGKGTAILYKSRDFVKWDRAENELLSSAKTGMWECPDFYPVGADKHILKASFKSQDYYVLGKYVAETDQFVAETEFLDVGSDLRHDYGKFFASKAFYDGEKNRRVLWAWVNESDSDSDALEKGWSGLQSVPRTVVLSDSGRQLVHWPIKEIEKLRGDKFSIQDKELIAGQVVEVSNVTASQVDVEVSFDVETLENAELMVPGWDELDPQLLCSEKSASVRGKVGPFGLLVLASKDLTEQTAIFFRVFKGSDNKYVVLMCSDQSRSSLREGLDKTTYGAFVDLDPLREKITLRSLIDHSIIESFGGEGRTCITCRVYPKLAINKEAHLYAFNNGTKSIKISTLNAWSVKSAQIVPMKKSSADQ